MSSMLSVRLLLRKDGTQECPSDGSTEFVRERSGTFADLARGRFVLEDFNETELIVSTYSGDTYVYRCVKCLRPVLPWAP